MSNERERKGFRLTAWAVLGMFLVGGCTHAEPATLEVFVADMLRNALAAFLW